MRRRNLMAGATLALAGLPLPALAQGAGARVLKFVPQANLTLLDPIQTAALVTRNHAAMVFDTLYGVDANYVAHPQMAEGHLVEEDGRRWTITLRAGLLFHDGTPVLARDVVASLRRWARRDGYGEALLLNTEELTALDDRRLRFRLRLPMTNLPYILGKEGPYLAAIMPERLAATEFNRPVPEVVGSGPFRFLAGERVPGARAVYARWERYQPRADGPPGAMTGPKLVHLDRVEWHTIPDASTAAAALQAGEMDWWELPTVDLLPRLRRLPAVQVMLTQKAGAMGVLKLNHLTAPFSNAGVRRALLPALQQAEFLMAARGEDRSGWRDQVGFFLPGTAMANDAGMAALTAPRSLEAARRTLRESGYAGEPVALPIPTDFPELNAFSLVSAALMEAIGLRVDRQMVDWGTVIQRIVQQRPVSEGGWSAFCTFLPGAYTLDPGVNWYMRGNGTAGAVGWPTSARLEDLRGQWLASTREPQRQSLARDLQQECFDNVTYVPLGQFTQPTAVHRRVSGVAEGFPVFHGVRKA